MAVDTTQAADSQRKLDRSLVHGMAWTGAMKWGAQILSWAATLIVAKLLTPADYGLLTMANVYLGLIQLINEFGLGAAIVRQRNLTEEQISALGGISIALGLLLWAASSALASAVSSLWGRPEVSEVIIVLGFTFLTTGVKVLPRSLLIRNLSFKQAAVIDAVDSIASLATTLVLAFMGYRYWSLVWGSVLGGTVSCIVALRLAPHRRHFPRDFGQILPSIRFGWHIVVSRFAWYFYSNADFAVVGRLFDQVVLGGYSYALTLATIPVTRISSLVGQVTPAVFSAVQDSRAELRRYLLSLTEVLAVVTFPFSVGMALVSHDFVLGALGEQWTPAIAPLQLLSLYAGFRSITTLHSQILNSVGQSSRQMWYSLLALAVLPVMFYIGGKWGGAPGVAWAWIIGFPLVMIPPYRAVFKATDTTVVQYVRALLPATAGVTAMAIVVLAVKATLLTEASYLVSLAVQALVGAVAYVAVLYGLQRNRLRDLIATVRKLEG